MLTTHHRVGEEPRTEHTANSWRGATLLAIAELLARLGGVLVVSAEAPQLRAHTKHICGGLLADARWHLEAAADILNPE